ncbi:MAG: amidohydrolase family protein [bacterium]|nr:amidohydrolase family protein [bacterium]
MFNNRFNKRTFILVFFFLVSMSISLAVSPAAAKKDKKDGKSSKGKKEVKVIVLKAAGMLDVKTGKIIRNVKLSISEGKIVAVNPKKVPVKATVIDLGEVVLLPGLTDCHTHITMQLSSTSQVDWATKSATDYALEAVPYVEKTLLAGFTTIRQCGTSDFVDIALNKAIEAGHIIGPRIISAGYAIGITGGHGDAGGLQPGLLEGGWREGVADGPAEVLKSVRYQIKHGAGHIKIMATAGVLSFEKNVGAQQMSGEEMKVVVDEAARHGLKVAAHAHGTDGIIAAVRAGVASIEHGSILTDEAIKLMIERGTYLVPTIYLTKAIPLDALPPLLRSKAGKVMPMMRGSVSKAAKAGVKFAFGTDAGVFPHGDNGKEFFAMVELGVSPLVAIQAATVNAADLTGTADRGTLEVGKLADIIAVKENPLKNIKTMEKVLFVMKGGNVYKNLR